MTAPVLIFSDGWAEACAERLNGTEAYRAAAAGWEGAVVLCMLANGGAEPLRAWLDLWHGECRVGRAASAADEDAARYVLSGSVGTWRAVLTGGAPPLLALMTGKLKLTKGILAELVPFAGAAQALVAAAAAVPATFPDEG